MMLRFVSLISLCLLSVSSASGAEPGRPSKEEMKTLLEKTKPGPEHEELAKFSGDWIVEIQMGGRDRIASAGGGTSYMTLENRFLWIGYHTRGRNAEFKGSFQIGFDRRHEEYILIAMDNSGTYFVTSQGNEKTKDGRIRLWGKDEDPYMKKMGLKKEFLHVLDLRNPDKLTIEVLFLDTRTEKRKEMPGMKFIFTRKQEEGDKNKP